MNPRQIDDMSWAMAEVYASVTDRILVNLAKYFPYIKNGKEPKNLFDYQARMLAQVGKVNRETAQIIMDSLGGADEVLRENLESAIMDALKSEDPVLQKAAEQGFLMGGGMVPPDLAPNQTRAFQAYYRQSADKLNLVNTVMLESTQAAYTATVADVTNKINRTQSIMNTASGEVVSGVSSLNEAVRDAVDKMVKNGITGFIDHGGHRWSPEAYVAMDTRTTLANTARAAVWEEDDRYGVDMYQVSHHDGARPLCYPWQGKVISRNGFSGTVKDGDGNTITVHSQDEIESFNYGGGLFGVNCGHYPISFIPGFSRSRPPEQNEEENRKEYEASQQQRGLERKLREERRDLAVLKAQGAPQEMINAQSEKVKQANHELDSFCDETGRARRKSREGTPIKASFPDPDTYTNEDFPTDQRDMVKDFFRGQTTKAETTQQAKPDSGELREMTPDERSAVKSYVSGENMYINQILRGRSGERMTDYDRELVKDLDSALDVPIGKRQTLYRSVDAETVFGKISPIDYDNLRSAVVYGDRSKIVVSSADAIVSKAVGKTIVEKGYMSTTKDFEIASEFGGFTGSEKPIVIKLDTPGSAHGRDLEEFDVEGEEQKEVLLARGQRYKVNKIYGEDGNIVVDADILTDK